VPHGPGAREQQGLPEPAVPPYRHQGRRQPLGPHLATRKARKRHHRVEVIFEKANAFDEDWKTNEQGVGTHWGLYDQSGNLKPALKQWLPDANPRTLKERSYRDVFVGSKLEKPFDLGIDTNRHRHDWLTVKPGVLTLAYPAGQQWGTMFITAGRPAPLGNRPSIDLSRYRSLSVELRATTNGQRVSVGIKDRAQPDNGSEITIEETLTSNWSTVALPLSLFANVDLRHVYVVFELIFQGSAAETVDMRNLRYAPAQVAAPVFPPAEMPFAVYTDAGNPETITCRRAPWATTVP